MVPVDTGEEDRLVAEINRLHQEISQLTMSLVQRAIRAGEILFKLKLKIPRPQWCKWLSRRLPNLNYRTQQAIFAALSQSAPYQGRN